MRCIHHYLLRSNITPPPDHHPYHVTHKHTARTLRRTKRRHARSRLGVSPDVIVRFELTATLLLVSTTFVVLNLPYFVVWLVIAEVIFSFKFTFQIIRDLDRVYAIPDYISLA